MSSHDRTARHHLTKPADALKIGDVISLDDDDVRTVHTHLPYGNGIMIHFTDGSAYFATSGERFRIVQSAAAADVEFDGLS